MFACRIYQVYPGNLREPQSILQLRVYRLQGKEDHLALLGMRLTGRQTMRFETCEDDILELAFTEVRDRKRAPNAYQAALMRMFA